MHLDVAASSIAAACLGLTAGCVVSLWLVTRALVQQMRVFHHAVNMLLLVRAAADRAGVDPAIGRYLGMKLPEVMAAAAQVVTPASLPERAGAAADRPEPDAVLSLLGDGPPEGMHEVDLQLPRQE